MRVWILESVIHYEGGEVVSVYSSEEAAKSALKEAVEQDSRASPSYFRQNFRLSSDGLTARGRNEDLIITEYEVKG